MLLAGVFLKRGKPLAVLLLPVVLPRSAANPWPYYSRRLCCKERIITVGRVFVPGCVVKERTNTLGRVLVPVVLWIERMRTLGRVVVSGGVFE